ncbi:hypothetical protein PVAP13_5NG645400 [Panicum virgatum]|uniref:Uncharacterized protein n=1 Tax=Panicum virgatum TaxID=38727 RepID=A0A8T0SC54_PANVG|nr:hypothetical protein PVAP13_5NG645400 [Panicum virgatum]
MPFTIGICNRDKEDSLKTLMDAIADGNLEGYCIRITECSKNIVLSGCPQITTAFLYISVLPTYLDVSFKRRIVSSYTQVDHQSFILYDELEKSAKTLLFRNVHMVDLSKCPNVHFGAAIDWLKLAFPELRILRALYCLSFQFDDLLYLLLRCPWIDEIDMAIDKSTITPRQSVVSSSSEVLGKLKKNTRKYYISCPSYDRQPNLVFLNISRLTLEGRDDIDDVDLLKISVLKNSLCYINIRNCTLLTDDGIDAAAMSRLMGMINITKFLCLRETSLTDDALCKFFGTSLEYLDVSETAVSMESLAPVIRRNCNLNCLKTAGCRSLLFEHDKVEHISGNKYGNFLQEIGSSCLEDVEMGWGFCPIQIEDLIPSFSKVRNMTVGLGTTLAENVLHALPVICPFLESVTRGFRCAPTLYCMLIKNLCLSLHAHNKLAIYIQVISDMIVRNLLESSVNLQVLCLHYCLGSLTSFIFQAQAPALRILSLQWVTPWITNDDLTILTKNCNLVELSLSGCKLLDSSSQEIIASGWPNLVLLHLEDGILFPYTGLWPSNTWRGFFYFKL